MDKMREEFEAWAVEESMLLDLEVVSGQVADWYKCDITDAAWQSWQASRAALVVKLPKDYFKGLTPENDYEQGFENGYNLALNSCKMALDKAGIKYE